MNKAICILFGCYILLLGNTMAQEVQNDSIPPTTEVIDELVITSDNNDIQTVNKKEKGYDPYRPTKAALLSAVLPGLGQAYNGSYWKIPIVYAGMGTLIYLVSQNDKSYREFRTALFAEIDRDPSTVNPFSPRLNEQNLRRLTDRYNRDRDFMIIMVGLIYIMNIVEAHVDAHLQEFSVADDLQARIKPIFGPNGMAGNQIGVGIAIRIGSK
jgi:hypothetical protein